DGPVVVVTGASAGVGRAVARAYGKRRAKVGLIARGIDGLNGARREIEESGGQALALPLDVADAAAVEQAAEQVEQELGPIDTWVNVAMVSVFSPIKEMKPEEYKRVTEVTYLGYVYGSLSALKRMLPRDRGTIVQVSSALAYRSIPLQSAYCASKHAIKGFTESLRTELLHDGSNVQVTMAHLPAVNTPQFNWVKSRLPHKPQPVPPIFQPEVAAEGILYAADQAGKRRDLIIGWPSWKAIWGEKFVPGYIDHVLARDGYSSQQYDGLVSADRQDNLWEPVAGDWGAHGDFDDRSHDGSWQLWVEMHRGLVAAAGAGAAALAALGAFAMWRD
ncbi:MAG TPA: SDR family oxidoreductase, partial [Candidatus Limnocylindria bacterium]|nr:SDR family oxidoreductase [Candidatus Limnocylindria bacterium]